MSTILKALQRVEGERPSGTGAVPRRAVRGDFVAEAGRGLMRRKRRARPSPVLWSGLAAAVLLAGLVWWRLPGREPDVVEATPAPNAPQSEPAARAPAQRAEHSAPPPTPREPEPAPPAIPEPAPPPVAAAAPEPELPSLREPELPPPPALPAEVAERLPPLGVTLDAPSPEVAAVAPAEPTPVEAPPAPPPLAAEKPAASPAPAVAPKPAVAAPRPAIAKPAPTPKPPPARVAKPAPRPPSVPSVLVERTSWHPSVERRVAWVSVEGLGTRELHEGDAVGALVVKEIRPSSVVFLHGADTVQRRVGERD